MKTYSAWKILLAVALIAGCESPVKKELGESQSGNPVILIEGSYALVPFIRECGLGFNAVQADPLVKVSPAGSGIAIHRLQRGEIDIALVSRPLTSEEENAGLLAYAVARTGVVVIINSGNPQIDRIFSHGLSTADLRKIFTSSQTHYWKDFLVTQDEFPVHHYHRADSSGAAELFSGFLYIDPYEMQGFPVIGEDQMVRAVQEDEYGIGYANVSDVFDLETGEVRPGLALMPVDLDENGSIEPREALCTKLSDFQDAICKTTYPYLLSRNLYMVVTDRRGQGAIGEFIEWVVRNGAEIADKQGYAPVPSSLADYNLYRLEKAR